MVCFFSACQAHTKVEESAAPAGLYESTFRRIRHQRRPIGPVSQDSKPQIAFAGRSNVGKSSIINALLHRKSLVKTSADSRQDPTHQLFRHQRQFLFRGSARLRLRQSAAGRSGCVGPDDRRDTSKIPRDLAAVVVLLDSRREPDERDARLIDMAPAVRHSCHLRTDQGRQTEPPGVRTRPTANP